VAKKVVPLPLPPNQELRSAELLGQFVRARRTQAGLSIQDAADFCSIAVGTLDKIERATGDVRLSNVLTACSLLGITISIEVKEKTF
jgi:transcriptional regulator with XRE-family HTH domain